MQEQKKVFISFSHDDINLVRNIDRELTKAGVEVFVDYKNVRGGESFEVFIHEKIEECNHFLLIWSEAAMSSQWVEIELHLLKSRMKKSSEGDVKIIACRYKDLPPPERIRYNVAIDFEYFEQVISDLFRALYLDADIPHLQNRAVKLEKKELIPEELIDNLKNGQCVIMVGGDMPIQNQYELRAYLNKNNIFLSEYDNDFEWESGGDDIIFNRQEKRSDIYKVNTVSSKLSIFILGYSLERAQALFRILKEEYLNNCQLTLYAAFITPVGKLSENKVLRPENIIRGELFSSISTTTKKEWDIVINHLKKRIKIKESVFILSDFENWVEERKIIKAFLQNGIETTYMRDCPAGENIETWIEKKISESDILLYLPCEFPIFEENHLRIKELVKIGIREGCMIVQYNRYYHNNVDHTLSAYFKKEDNKVFESLFLSEFFISPIENKEAVITFKKKYAVNSKKLTAATAQGSIENHLQSALKSNYDIPFDSITDRVFLSKEAIQAVEKANYLAGEFYGSSEGGIVSESFFKAKLEYAKLLRFQGDWSNAISLLEPFIDSRFSNDPMSLRRQLRNDHERLFAQYRIEYGALKFESGLVEDKKIRGLGSIEDGLRILKSENLDIEFVKVLKLMGNLYREQGDMEKAKNLINSSKYLMQVLKENHLTSLDENAQKIIYFDAMREYANLVSTQDDLKEAETVLNFLVDEMSSFKLTEPIFRKTVTDAAEKISGKINQELQSKILLLLMPSIEATVGQSLEERKEALRNSLNNDPDRPELRSMAFYLGEDEMNNIFDFLNKEILRYPITEELLKKNSKEIAQKISDDITNDIADLIFRFVRKKIDGLSSRLHVIKNVELPGKEYFMEKLKVALNEDFPYKAYFLDILLSKAKLDSAANSIYLKTTEHFLGIVKYSLGQIYIKNNKLMTGLATLFESLNILQRYDNPVRISFVLHWIGKAMSGLSWKYDIDIAKNYLLKAQRLREDCNHRYFLAYSQLELGNFYKTKALKESRATGNDNIEVNSQNFLDEAEKHYMSALNVFKELGKILDWGNALFQLGKCETLRNNCDIQKAKRCYKEAREKFRELDPPHEGKVREVNFEIVNLSKKEKEKEGHDLSNIPLSNYIKELKELKGENEVDEPLYLNEIGEYRFHSWLKRLVSEENDRLKDTLKTTTEQSFIILEIGIGDDAAVLEIPIANDTGESYEVVLTTDAAPGSICQSHKVEGGNYAAHFSVIHSISDLLAMGSIPVAVLLNMYLDRNATIEYAQEVIEVVTRKSGEYGALLVGGDIKERDTQSIGCVGVGIVQKGKAIKRSSAAVDQIVAISLAKDRSKKMRGGEDGIRKIGQRWAADVLNDLKDRFESKSQLKNKLDEYLEEPDIKQDLLFLPDREMIAGAKTGKICSAIDTSDGFMSCLEILGRESKVDFILEEALIENVIADDVKKIANALKIHEAQFLFNAGHDWEIVMTVAEEDFQAVRQAFRSQGGDIAPLGRVVDKNPGLQKEIGIYTKEGEIKKVPIFTDEKFVTKSYEERIGQWEELDVNYFLNIPDADIPASVRNIKYKELSFK